MLEEITIHKNIIQSCQADIIETYRKAITFFNTQDCVVIAASRDEEIGELMLNAWESSLKAAPSPSICKIGDSQLIISALPRSKARKIARNISSSKRLEAKAPSGFHWLMSLYNGRCLFLHIQS
jgi:hypothetical protein